jgi:hypothetical protein
MTDLKVVLDGIAAEKVSRAADAAGDRAAS